MMRTSRILLALAAALTGVALFAADPPPPPAGNSAPATTTREYVVKDIGTLRLAAPKSWDDSYKRVLELGSLLEEVQFQPHDTKDFVVIVQVIHMADDAKVREFDTHAACLDGVKPELATALEPKPEVHDFKGVEASGSWLRITDKTVYAPSPKAGEFKYLTLGYARLGPVILAFRLVSNRPGDAETLALVEAVRSARLARDK